MTLGVLGSMGGMRRRMGMPPSAAGSSTAVEDPDQDYLEGGGREEGGGGFSTGVRSTPPTSSPGPSSSRSQLNTSIVTPPFNPNADSIFSTGSMGRSSKPPSRLGQPPSAAAVQSTPDDNDDYALPTEAYSRAQEQLSRPAPVLRQPTKKRELLGALIDTAGVIGTGFGVPLSVSERISNRVRYGNQPQEIEQQERDTDQALKGAQLEQGLRNAQGQVMVTREAAKSRQQIAESNNTTRKQIAGTQATTKQQDIQGKYDRDQNMRELRSETDEPDYDKGESLVVDKSSGKRYAKLGTAGAATAKAQAKADAESIPVAEGSDLAKAFPGRKTITGREFWSHHQKGIEKLRQESANYRTRVAEAGRSSRHAENRTDRNSTDRELARLYKLELDANNLVSQIEKGHQSISLPGAEKAPEFDKAQKDINDILQSVRARREQLEATPAEAETTESKSTKSGGSTTAPPPSLKGTKPSTGGVQPPPPDTFKSRGKQVGPDRWQLRHKSGVTFEYNETTGTRKRI